MATGDRGPALLLHDLKGDGCSTETAVVCSNMILQILRQYYAMLISAYGSTDESTDH